MRVDQKLAAQVPLDARFSDEQGAAVTIRTVLKGRPVILLPIFYRCQGVCNLEIQGILASLNKLPKLIPGRDLDIVVVSVNPKEGPALALAKKQATMAEYDGPRDPAGWHFLTGDMPNIRRVTDAIGFQFTYDFAKDRVNHPSCVAVLTPKGVVSSYLLGIHYREAAIEQALRVAKLELVGKKDEDSFFGCIHLDPVTGHRSLVILQVLKVAAGATVLALLGSIVALSVRRRANA